MRWILALAVLVASCAAYSEEKTIFVVSNHSPDAQWFYVNGNQVGTVPANSVGNAVIEIPVPYNQVTNSYPSGPYQVDKVTTVTLVFKNQRTGRLSRDIQCVGGAKQKISVALYDQAPYEPYALCGY